MIVIKVNNIYTDIIGEMPDDVYKKLEKELSFRPEGFQFANQYKTWIKGSDGKPVRRVWDGWKKQCWKNKTRTYFPSGLLSIVIDYFKTNNIQYVVEDHREKPSKSLSLTTDTNFLFYDYQTKVIQDACKTGRGIIQIATGGGKTPVIGGIIAELNVSPFLVFVTSIDLLIQAKKSLENLLRIHGSNLQIGQIGGGVIDIRDINVVTVQTAIRALGKKWDKNTKFDSDDTDDQTPIEKHKNEINQVIHTAKGVACDEVQHWKADTCQIISKELTSAYARYGLSATPFRDSGDDIMIQACFGKKICQISASYLIQRGYLVRPEINMIHLKEEKSHFKTWAEIYKHKITDNNCYNNLVSNLANGYINNGKMVLVLIQHINHGEKLSSMIDGSVFLSGSSSKNLREDKLEQLRHKEISCIVSSSIFDEGVDVQCLDCVILAGGGKSKTRAMQRIGRITRLYPGKATATAIDFRIHDKFLLEHSKEREKMYRTEPEYIIKEFKPNEFIKT